MGANSTLTGCGIERGNVLGVSDGQTIAAALGSNTTLTELFLAGTGLGDGEGKAIGSAMRTNSTLTKLNLNENSLGEGGGRAIGEALGTNTTLTRLALLGNNFPNGVKSAVQSAWGQRRGVLDLGQPIFAEGRGPQPLSAGDHDPLPTPSSVARASATGKG